MSEGCFALSRDKKTLFCPQWGDMRGLSHGVTTRLALPQSGKAEFFTTVRRARAANALPIGPTLGADQVHGAGIYTIHEPLGVWNRPAEFLIETELNTGQCPATDSLVTTIPGLLLVIQTADCLPLFLVDVRRRWCALAHCGWRGVRQGLAVKTLQALLDAGSDCKNIQAWIGPCIRVGNYEVGEKLVREFESAFPGAPVSPDGTHLDLAAIVTHQLRSAGLAATQILDSRQGTLADPKLYHSYRCEGEAAGRMVSFIGFDVDQAGDADRDARQPRPNRARP